MSLWKVKDMENMSLSEGSLSDFLLMEKIKRKVAL